MKRLRLQTSLILLLVAAAVGTFVLLGAGTLFYRLPQIAESSRATGQREAEHIANLLEFHLRGIESRISPAVVFARSAQSPEVLQPHLDAIVGDGSVLSSLYVIAPDGRIEAVGLPPGSPSPGATPASVPAAPLQQAARSANKTVWSDHFRSIITGKPAVGVAIPAGDRVVVGEISPRSLLDAMQAICHCMEHVVLAVDARGELIAGHAPGPENRLQAWAGHPAIKAAGGKDSTAETIEQAGERLHAGYGKSPHLGWTFVVGVAAGMDNPLVRTTVFSVVGGAFAALLIGALLAPLLARQIMRPLRQLILRTRQMAEGDYRAPARPHTRIAEFDALLTDMDGMAAAIRERQEEVERTASRLAGKEQELSAIFNFSPVAMSVSDALDNYRIIAVNHAWEKQFGRTQDAVAGSNGKQIGLWTSSADRKAFVAGIEATGAVLGMEAGMAHSDGTRLLCRISGRIVEVGEQRFLIMVQEDITERRRIENEIRDINAELETRVQRRTEDLARTNEELEATLHSLKAAQEGLVNSENLAALGRLVAGVSHELNTPLGNGLMAATTLRDQLRQFRASLDGGLKRQAFETFLDDADTASHIMIRNLERGANLLNSFKRLAVDQASAQRRHFSLAETIDETLSVLRPTLKRTPFRIETDIPPDIELDSYPGALEQVLTNLINNAIFHGFEGRDHGLISISAERIDQDHLRLRFADDGCGMPAAMLQHVFEPFFTTKLGRGGSGLGLHIARNAVIGMLGGNVRVESSENAGLRYEITLPLVAPHREERPRPAEMTSERTIVGK